MSSRKQNSYSSGNNQNRNKQRNQYKERTQRQKNSYEQDKPDSHAIQILKRILNDTDEQNFHHRITNATQLLNLMEKSRTMGASDSLQFRQEQMALLDICIHDERLQRAIEMPKAPATMKSVFIHLVSGLACFTRLDLVLSWIFDRLSVWANVDVSMTADMKKNREWKKWLLGLLNQVLVDSANDQYTYRQTIEMASTVLASVISFLDTMDSVEYLPIIIDTFSIFSQQYADFFGLRFTDVIDLLVEWNTDETIPDSKKTTIISAYSKFGAFWKLHLPYTMMLLDHFLSNIENTMLQLDLLYETDPAQFNYKKDNCTLFMSCYGAILKALLSSGPDTNNYEQSPELGYSFETILPRLLQMLTDSLKYFPDTTWIILCRDILMLFVLHVPSKYRQYQYQIYLFLAEITEDFISSEPFKQIETLIQLVHLWGPNITKQVFERILDTNTSPLYYLRKNRSNCKKVEASAVSLLRYLVRMKVADECRYFVNQTIVSFLDKKKNLVFPSELTTDLEPKRLCKTISSLKSNGFITKDPEYAQCILPCDVEELEEELEFFCYFLLDITRLWPEFRYRNVLTILNVFVAAWQSARVDLCERILDILIAYWASLNYMLHDENGFTVMSCILTDLIDHWYNLSYRLRKTICNTVYSLLNIVRKTDTVQFGCLKDLRYIIFSLVSVPENEVMSDVKKEVICIVTKYSFIHGCSDLIGLLLQSIQRSMSSTNLEIQNGSKDLAISLNPFLISHTTTLEDKTILSIQNILMATPHTGSFRPIHYEITMQRLGIGQHLLLSHDELHKELDDASDWARRIFYTCDIIKNMKTTSQYKETCEEMPKCGLENMIDDSQTLTNYWSTWESARYCILSRLRTPFGTPQQTLAALERTLSGLLSEESHSNLDKNGSLCNILLLLNSLEIQISNASNGCATNALPSVPRPSLFFFRTNKKTCQDYFIRIRPTMIKAAKISGSDDLLITHLIKALKENEDKMAADPFSWFKQINSYMKDLVEVCIKKKHTDMIYGLHSWFRRAIYEFYRLDAENKKLWSFEGFIGPVRKNSGTGELKKTTWFKTAELFASGCYELAVDSLTELKSIINNDENGIVRMLSSQAVSFYACMEDYSAIQNILVSTAKGEDDLLYQSLRDFNSNERTVKDQMKTFQDLQQFASTASLDTCTNLSRLNNLRNYLVPDLQRNQEITAEIQSRLKSSLKDNTSYHTNHLLELQLLDTDWSRLLANAQDWSYLQADTRSNTFSDTKHWARLNTHFDSLYNLNDNANPVVASTLSSIQIHTAKVARRQGNIRLAESLIEKAILLPEAKYKAYYERSKILFKHSDYSQAMGSLNSIVLHVASEDKELGSKAYRSIARYLQTCPEDQASDLFKKLDASFIQHKATTMQSSVETCIDYALEKSIETNTTDGRPWFEYATHNYKQAWRILEEMVRPESTMTVILWAKKHIQMNLLDIDNDIDREKVEKALFGLLKKHSPSIEENNCMSCFPLMNGIRQAVPFLKPENEAGIVHVLDTLHKMIIDKLYASAQAYFHFLSLEIHVTQNGTSHTSMVTTATLRILRTLSKYGTALKDVFDHHIGAIRVELWKHVIPQLFAQLNHPGEFVREAVSRFILVICDTYPREIMYDVIVSLHSSKTSRDTIKTLEMITHHIMARDALLWVSTTKMAEEIQVMTVLVEEKIIDMIGTLQFDVMQNFRDLDEVYANLSKTATSAEKEDYLLEKYHACMSPIIAVVDKFMKDLSDMEQDSILTPHHKWFLKTYGDSIRKAHSLLRQPKCAKDYREGWTRFQSIHGVLMADTHKLRILELSQVSPYLFGLKDTSIGMPGNSDSNCYIESFGTNVVVIPTKTKPKKLDFRGSDGKRYMYLFKGHEDLHLDERIMQLLTTTNGLLSESRNTASRGMRARTYTVIPLRDRSGMIQWVNDATPMFALYKQWQKRESAAHMVLTSDKPNEAFLAAIAKRPTEHFEDKVYAALKEAGLRVSSNRKNWPKHILKKVYTELLKETPGDLLERELYYSSPTAQEWIQKSNAFARSLAVTSMIGYIIGLGDRHLDNMLVDFKSGEMIHIDYGVCFEKGRSLRVPEVVPYRLTQNLFNALGVLGLDGPFKSAAEETMHVLRKHREVLITLLDAFVYDPLVDWEHETEAAGHRQMKELQRSLGLLAVHISQNHAQLGYDYQATAGSLSELKESISHWQMFGSGYINEDDEEESEEEDEEEEDPSSGGFDQSGNETTGYQVPIYVLESVKDRLLGFWSIVSKARSPLEGILPLLESIIIIEADEDNELLPAQKAAKSVFDMLARMNKQLKRLEKQIESSRDSDSEWNYSQLLEFVQQIQSLYEEYCSSLKILEEFGPEKINSVTTVEDHNDSSTSEDNDLTETTGSQTNNVVKTSHVEKIMKRIRAKLEGDDFGAQKMSVSEQVRKSVEQATSADNLCLMYEGWTGWI
ncbi:hypothetical protein BY458DRAFT_584368 [Sporodiniella umbellata]|nr:hypothetical protein BY458DRAFT_584368 [Sporodiniella umbellata]